MIKEEKIKSLYEDGLADFSNFFDNDLLNELVFEKDNLFKEYPYGQDDNLNKKSKADFVRPGSYMIWDVIEKKPIFSKILENKYVTDLAKRVLGDNYTVASFYIRKTPKIDSKLNPHIDYQGGLSFSILLDDISLNNGETFFYKKSHKLPPPPFTNFNNPSYKATSITGKIGDTFFWFPDCWHGRNPNSCDKDTTILMCHLGNSNHPSADSTGRKVNYSKKEKKHNSKNRKKYLDLIFRKFGKSSNNFFKHFIYCLLYFKIKKFSELAIRQQTVFTRNKYGESEIDNFSIKKYLKATNFYKVIVISLKTSIKKIIGTKLTKILKKKSN